MSTTPYTQRLEAPAVSAVALADVLSYLRLPTATPEVSLITHFMESAVQAVELYCGLGLIRQKWRFVTHKWTIRLPDRKSFRGPDVLVRYPGCSIKEMKLARTPLISVDAVKVAGTNGLMEDIAPALYQIESVGQSVFLRNAYGADLPNPTKDRFGIRVDATIGFGDTPSAIPATLRHAILVLVASYYENRGKGYTDMPQSVKTLLAPWREVNL
ncbi:MAG: hypothetical protein ACKO57_09275 [Alphaproteobacteria bacterium]